jgi:hypothetical protein
MRWPWRGRGRHAAHRVVFIGTSPFDVADSIAAAAVPDQPEDTHAVELGFADGSTLALAGDDPRAVALRTVAAYLTTKD